MGMRLSEDDSCVFVIFSRNGHKSVGIAYLVSEMNRVKLSLCRTKSPLTFQKLNDDPIRSQIPTQQRGVHCCSASELMGV